MEGEPGDTRDLTYADLTAEVKRAANALLDLGVTAGDRVAIYLPDDPGGGGRDAARRASARCTPSSSADSARRASARGSTTPRPAWSSRRTAAGARARCSR
ncbi:AMP-binding protein [Clavibacter tessellarius]|uniref:AMP-binding protein n=1 Tax=Clavibacter tessellarius TaxID=31965 RepID=UPI0032558B32